MKLRVVVGNGLEHEVIGIDDAETWMKSFVGRGTSQLGDWLEVAPLEGTGRTFVRASEVVAVQLIDDDVGARMRNQWYEPELGGDSFESNSHHG